MVRQVWVQGALADVSGAGRNQIAEIAEALKEDGLLAPDRRFETVDQLLDGLDRTVGQLTETVNSPPLDVAGLRGGGAKPRGEARRGPPAHMSAAAARWRAAAGAAGGSEGARGARP